MNYDTESLLAKELFGQPNALRLAWPRQGGGSMLHSVLSDQPDDHLGFLILAGQRRKIILILVAHIGFIADNNLKEPAASLEQPLRLVAVFNLTSDFVDGIGRRKVAVVNPFPELREDLKFTIQVATNRGARYKLFDTIEEAEEWLCE